MAIGASAGGLEAIQQFFKAMPSDQELAFIVVVHLDPNHSSLLPELLQKQTPIKVVQIANGISVEPNRIYVIPPNKSLIVTFQRLSFIANICSILEMRSRLETSELYPSLNAAF